MDEQKSRISIGDIFGDIRDSYIAGRDIVVNHVLGGDRGEQRASEALKKGMAELWINGFLKKSLEAGRFVPVPLSKRTNLCSQSGDGSTNNELTIKDLEEQSYLVKYKSVLLLGEAGSGKTTLLLELVNRRLASRPSIGPDLPSIPVFVNLADWTPDSSGPLLSRDKRGYPTLIYWLIHYISKTYEIPGTFVARWLHNGDLALYLDGLDEIFPADRKRCVADLNELLSSSLCTYIISSRTSDYAEMEFALNAKAVLEIGGLSLDQTLSFVENQPDKIRSTIATLLKSEDMRELLSSPLLLSIIVGSIRADEAIEIVNESGVVSPESIFDMHTKTMLNRERGRGNGIDKRDILRTCRSVARFLVQQSATQFEFEQMTFEIIDTAKGRAWMRALYVTTSAVLLATLCTLGLSTGYFESFTDHPIWDCLIGGASVIGGGFYVHRLFFGKAWTRYDSFTIRWKGLGIGCALGSIGGMIGWVLWIALSVLIPGLIGLIAGFLVSVSVWLLVVVLIVVVIVMLANKKNPFTAVTGLGIFCSIPYWLGLAVLWLGGGDSNLIADDLGFKSIMHVVMLVSLGMGISGAVLGTMLGGIVLGARSIKSRPGKSLSRSLLNSLLVSLLGVVAAASIVLGCHYILNNRFMMEPKYELLFLVVGLVLFALTNGPMALRTILLRVVWAAEGSVPFTLKNTLDGAVDQGILRRVTSGFRFLHKLHLEYFALMADADLQALSE